MIAYLHYVKPRKAELIVDEMLDICSDIDAWKKKKAVEEAMPSTMSYCIMVLVGERIE